VTSDTMGCGSKPATASSLPALDAMFHRLVECAGQGLGWADLDGNIVYMNPSLCRMLDLAPDIDVSGLHMRRFRPADAAQVAGEMLRVARDQGSWSGEVPLLSDQGRVILTRHDIHLLRDAAGTPIAFGCAITDLSQQKQQEQKLQRSKSKYRALVENIPQRVFYKDRQLRYLAVNRHYAEDKGAKPEDAVGQDDYALNPRDLADKYRLDDLRIMASGQAEEYDEAHDRDGERITVHTIKTPVRDEDGQVIGICGIYWDVTESQLAREALTRSEALLAEAQALAHLGNWNLDLVTGQAIWSDEEYRLLGYAPGQVTASVENFQRVVHPDDRDAVMAEMRRAMTPGETRPFLIEHRVVRPDADNSIIRIVEQQGRVLFDAAGQPLRMYGTTLDVTEQRQAEALLRTERNFTGAVLDNAGALLLVLDREGRIRRFNRACETISGYSFAEVEGRLPWDFLLLPEERDRVREQALRALSNDPETLASIHTNHWLDKDGGKHLVEWHRASLLDDQGRLEYLVAIGIDVTEKREVEAALLRSEETYARAEAIAHLGSWDWDIASGGLRWTDEIYRIFGLAPQAFGATYQAFLDAIHPDDRQQVSDAVNASVADANVAYNIEHRVLRPDGEVRSVHERGRVYRDEYGSPIRMIGSVHDITERKRADQALRDSERLLRTVIDEIPDPIVLKDYKGDFLLCNQAVAQLYNTTPEAMIGKHDGDFGVSREMADSFRQNVLAIMARGEAQIVFEDSRDAVSGAIRHFKSVKKPFKDNAGGNQILVVAQDITDVIRAQRQVAESERRMQDVMEITREGIWDWQVATGKVIHNTQWYETLRLADGEMVDSVDAFAELIHPEDKEQVWQRLDSMLKGGDDYYSEHRLVRRDGQTIWVQDRGRIVERDAQGHPLRVVGSFSDITERRLAEQELKHHRSHLEELVRARTAEVEKEGSRNAMIVNTALDGFFTAGMDGRLLDCNQIYCRMLGYSREEMLQLSFLDIDAIETPEETAAHMRTLIEHGHDRFDTRHRHKSGRTIDVEVNVTVAQIGDESLFFSFVHDISERKAGEAALVRARDEAERANRAKSEFLSRMSHELRTPLNAILGFAQLLERANLGEFQTDNVGEILHAGRHLLELINEVLDLARIESGKFTISLEPMPLRPLIADCLGLMRPQAENSGIKLSEAALGCDEYVLADPTRLKQVLLNLLSNAVKYNRALGSVSLTCQRLAGVFPGGAIQIRVSDTGPGLSAEQQARLFIAFERLGAEDTAVEGTGIGLALSKRLTELMGGEIEVESTPGCGTTFCLRLPLAQQQLRQAESSPADAESEVSTGAALSKRFDLLCIEDNSANMRLVERILALRSDIRLLKAATPGLGLELAQARHPALILLDINLPEMDGFEVLRCLRENPATRNIPVIGISANAMPRDIERARAAGFVDYLTKPLDIGQFLAVVERNLDCLSEPESP